MVTGTLRSGIRSRTLVSVTLRDFLNKDREDTNQGLSRMCSGPSLSFCSEAVFIQVKVQSFHNLVRTSGTSYWTCPDLHTSQSFRTKKRVKADQLT